MITQYNIRGKVIEFVIVTIVTCEHKIATF